MSTEEYEPPSDRDGGEPDFVAKQLIRFSDTGQRMHRADFRVHFDGFDFVTFVDRSIPVHRHDEVIAIHNGDRRAHGIVADSRRYESETEFYAIPYTEEIEAM